MKYISVCVLLGSILLVSPRANGQDPLVSWYAEAGLTGAQAGNVALGIQFNPNLAMEVGYRVAEESHSETAFVPATDALDGFEAAVRLSVPLSRRLTLTSRFGVYNYGAEALRFDLHSGEFSERRLSATDPVFGVGLLYNLSTAWGLTMEYAHSDGYGASGRSSEGRLALGLRFSH